MPASLPELKKEIASVRRTGRIAQTMRMVPTVKFNQTEEKDKGYTLYNDTLRKTVPRLMSAQIVDHSKNENVPVNSKNLAKLDYIDVFGLGIISGLIQARPEIKSTGCLAIIGDRRLVGSYNPAIIKNMVGLFEDPKTENKDVRALAVGRVGAQFFEKSNMNVVYGNFGISDVPSSNEVLPIVSTAIKMYLNGVHDELYVCYTHHVNSLSSAFRIEEMLPISDLDTGSEEAEAHAKLGYDIDPDIDTALKALLPQFTCSTIYGAISDAKTAEHAGLMTAMQSASDNASDLVSRLTTQMNRVRQAQITTGLSEVTGGANTLE